MEFSDKGIEEILKAFEEGKECISIADYPRPIILTLEYFNNEVVPELKKKYQDVVSEQLTNFCITLLCNVLLHCEPWRENWLNQVERL